MGHEAIWNVIYQEEWGMDDGAIIIEQVYSGYIENSLTGAKIQVVDEDEAYRRCEVLNNTN